MFVIGQNSLFTYDVSGRQALVIVYIGEVPQAVKVPTVCVLYGYPHRLDLEITRRFHRIPKVVVNEENAGK